MRTKLTPLNLALAAVLAAGVGGMFVAEAQHGRTADREAHFEAIAERLELTATQREELREPIFDALEAMERLHRLHDVIAADLSEGQKNALAQMIHDGLYHSENGSGHRPHGRGHH